MSRTPLMAVYYRLMGAKVGRRCALETALLLDLELVSIGDDTSIGGDTQLLGTRVENGQFLVGAVDIGARCFVGIHSTLGLDVRMGDDARLGDLSLLADRMMIAPASHGAGRRRRPATSRFRRAILGSAASMTDS